LIVDMAAQVLSRHIGIFGEAFRPRGVLWRITVAELHAGILGAQVRGVVAATASAAGRDEDVTGQRRIGRRERFCGDGAQLRIVGGRSLPATGHHEVRAFAVVIFSGVDAAHEAEVVHLLGGIRQKFADMDAGHRGWYRTERAAGGGARLRIPAFELAQSAVHVEHDDAFLIALQLVGDDGIGEHAQPAHHGAAGGRGHGAQELPASDPML
jgi:hypothetical protein